MSPPMLPFTPADGPDPDNLPLSRADERLLTGAAGHA